MSPAPPLSVVIPTRARDDGTVARCTERLADQLRGGDEVIVSIDGTPEAGAFEGLGDVRVVSGPKAGPGGARNRALPHARGEIILFLNDDVIPQPGLLDTHRAAHADRATPAMVLGDAPWKVPDDDRVIDRLMRESSMVFFYDRMENLDRERDWGFRHAWTLNLSLPASIMLRYDDRLACPMFDDLEWAYRVQRTSNAPVLFRPEACVVHRHRYTPTMLLRREALLGHQAEALRQTNHACYQEVFGKRFEGVGTPAVDAACAAFAELLRVADEPSDAVDGKQLARLFDGCGPWRQAARDIGYLAAIRGEGPDRAQTLAEETIGSAVGAG